ncbi:hypothetical protein VCHA53O466_50054 [Vibrio chagasii]|nr:hypothetical protein VCHA53O466_50054 [Vibrio chagasii]
MKNNYKVSLDQDNAIATITGDEGQVMRLSLVKVEDYSYVTDVQMGNHKIDGVQFTFDALLPVVDAYCLDGVGWEKVSSDTPSAVKGVIKDAGYVALPKEYEGEDLSNRSYAELEFAFSGGVDKDFSKTPELINPVLVNGAERGLYEYEVLPATHYDPAEYAETDQISLSEVEFERASIRLIEDLEEITGAAGLPFEEYAIDSARMSEVPMTFTVAIDAEHVNALEVKNDFMKMLETAASKVVAEKAPETPSAPMSQRPNSMRL